MKAMTKRHRAGSRQLFSVHGELDDYARATHLPLTKPIDMQNKQHRSSSDQNTKDYHMPSKVWDNLRLVEKEQKHL